MGQSAIRRGMVHRLGPHGLISDSSAIEESRRIREWLLGILRFAVTLEPSDRAVVTGLAVEMDRLGSDESQSRFSYFTRTSTKLCDCILQSMTSINWRNSAFTSKRLMTVDCVEPLKVRSSRNVINRHVPDSRIESICGRASR